MDAWLSLARGPLFRFALAICLLGLIRQVVIVVLSLRSIFRHAGDRSPLPAQSRRNALTWILPRRALRRRPLLGVASVLFHAGILAAPIFLAGHVLLIRRGTGLSWPALPALLADALTVAAIVGLLAVILIRLSGRTERALSRRSDHATLWIVLLPFLTGFFTRHPSLGPLPFDVALLLHVLTANLALAALPFTKLVHAILMPAAHFVADAGWRFRPEAGERVAEALNKESQRI